ncbi:hypothetical protein BJV74DRAFT_872797 [Russula compacta]|nr:hypothetical protein BJV74DRAFT_872797 [Russula compacta]
MAQPHPPTLILVHCALGSKSPMSSHKHTPHPVRGLFSLLVNALVRYVYPSGPWSWSPIDDPLESEAETAKNIVTLKDPEWFVVTQPGRGCITIDVLPNDVLLHIFDCYRLASMNHISNTWQWTTLVHVCRRWRHIVFESSRYPDLRLICTYATLVRRTQDVWPNLPIIIDIWNYSRLLYPEDESSIVATLGHYTRISQITLSGLTNSFWGRLALVMKGPFPALTSLHLGSNDDMSPVLSDAFSGGFAPLLQRLWLVGISVPSLPVLLLFSPNLSELYLIRIPHSGYISPQVIAICLSSLTMLKSLRIEFRSPNYSPDQTSRPPPPLTRAVLPALKMFVFRGASEYLDDLMAQIDAPLLNNIDITFFHQLVFSIPQLPQFIGRTGNFDSPNRALVIMSNYSIEITLYQPGLALRSLTLRISCGGLDWQLSSLTQACSPFLPSLSGVEELEVRNGSLGYLRSLQVDMENTQWLEVFRLFTAVRTLYIRGVVPPVVQALESLAGERTTDMLPALRDIFVDNNERYTSTQKIIKLFLGRASVHTLRDYPAIEQDKITETVPRRMRREAGKAELRAGARS